MSRESSQRITDILEAIQRCRRYADSLESEVPVIAEMAFDAVERNLLIIGEAASHLPPDVTGAHPEVALPAIRGMRNILVHEYFGVDAAIIRDVIDVHLEPIATALRLHLSV